MKFRLNIFGIQLVWRIVLICLLSLGLGFSVIVRSYFFIPLILVLSLMYSVFNLYAFLKKTNENLYTFLLNLKHQDFQTSFPKTNKNGHFLNVNEKYNEILKQFEYKQEEQKQISTVFIQTLEHLDKGILVYRNNGEIVFANTTFKNSFNITSETHINDVYAKIPFSCFKSTNKRENKWILKPEDYDYKFIEPWHVEVKYTLVYKEEFKICFFSQEDFNKQQNINGWLSFVKVISHELGNGITPVKSIAETIVQDPSLKYDESGRVRKGLQMILKQTDDLIAFSERYRQLVQLPELKLEECILGEVFEELASTFAYTLEKEQIDFVIKGDVNLHLKLDKSLLKQAFSNLIVNSIWALKEVEYPSIHITVHKRNLDTLIIFEDNGCGIAENKRYQVFVPFYSSKSEGSGIGLSLTQQIIWKHHGRIFVESEENKYTRFLITLASH